MKPLIYIAGPYSGDIDNNIAVARKVAIWYWENGYAVFCPHLNTANFQNDCKAGYNDYIDGDLSILARCDAIVMLANWRLSKGAVKEHAFAAEHDIPVYYWDDNNPPTPPISATLSRYPQQVARFLTTMRKMYQTHLEKNEDYSPANVAGMGNVGILVRIWDKCVRLMNLSGFDIQVEHRRAFAPKNPRFETVADTFLDLATYGVIGLINTRDEWGK